MSPRTLINMFIAYLFLTAKLKNTFGDNSTPKVTKTFKFRFSLFLTKINFAVKRDTHLHWCYILLLFRLLFFRLRIVE